MGTRKRVSTGRTGTVCLSHYELYELLPLSLTNTRSEALLAHTRLMSGHSPACIARLERIGHQAHPASLSTVGAVA